MGAVARSSAVCIVYPTCVGCARLVAKLAGRLKEKLWRAGQRQKTMGIDVKEWGQESRARDGVGEAGHVREHQNVVLVNSPLIQLCG